METLGEEFLKAEFEGLFHTSIFQKSLSLVENGIIFKRNPIRFWSKNKNFSIMKQGHHKADIWQINRKENAKYVEYHRTPALMCAEIVTRTLVLRMAIFDT